MIYMYKVCICQVIHNYSQNYLELEWPEKESYEIGIIR